MVIRFRLGKTVLFGWGTYMSGKVRKQVNVQTGSQLHNYIGGAYYL